MGRMSYRLDALDKATGHVVLGLPELQPEMRINWERHRVPSSSAASAIGCCNGRRGEPTGEADRLEGTLRPPRRGGRDEAGTPHRGTPARRGEALVVRYLIEAKQDLSLVTLEDDRAAGAEPGYDFAGCGMGDRTWYATAGARPPTAYISTTFRGGSLYCWSWRGDRQCRRALQLRSRPSTNYYAPEYAGNSTPARLRVVRPDTSGQWFLSFPHPLISIKKRDKKWLT